jgi:hypothetical protein
VVRFQTGGGKVFLCLRHCVQTGSEVHPASYPVCSGGGRSVKLTTHLHVVPRLRIRGAVTPLSQCAIMAWYLIKYKETLSYIKFVIITNASTCHMQWFQFLTYFRVCSKLAPVSFFTHLQVFIIS